MRVRLECGLLDVLLPAAALAVTGSVVTTQGQTGRSARPVTVTIFRPKGQDPPKGRLNLATISKLGTFMASESLIHQNPLLVTVRVAHKQPASHLA